MLSLEPFTRKGLVESFSDIEQSHKATHRFATRAFGLHCVLRCWDPLRRK